MRRALLVLVAVAALGTSTPAAAAPDPPYRPPVDAEVVDPFRPPATRFGPGNRGLEYGTDPGTPVRAVADGRVTFAGSVAGTLHVTVLHEDGIRTSYSFLRRIDVVVGQRVHQGDEVGVTDGHLHLGARRGDAYFDPASLFGAGAPHVHLVPFDDPPGEGERGERSAISQLLGGAGAVLEHVTPVGTWIRDGGSQLLRTAGHYGHRFAFPSSFIDSWWTIYQGWQRARVAAGRPCTKDGITVPPPRGRRVAVLVAGLGSDSVRSTVDHVHTDQLGYATADVVRFSYAGGRVPDPTDAFTGIATTEYGALETQGDLHAAGRRLADLVEQVAEAAPGAPIDVIAHSQGGVVARLAVIELERRHGVAWLERVGMLATLGSPLGGADLATAVHAWTSTDSGGEVLDVFAAATDQELDDDSSAVAQLAETSDVVAELQHHPVPESLPAVSIAARGDAVVPVPRSRAPGMDPVVVPLVGRDAHSDLPGSPQATRELALAQAGLPPGCQTFRDALLDQATGEGISLAEDLAGASGLLLAVRADVRGQGGAR
ncbi:MAG: peptidoglycan DD-metalloendopeptidase family protein [Acidimicrobiales bacterium]